MISPEAVKRVSRWRKVASDTLNSAAISKSSRCPYFFKHYGIAIMDRILWNEK